MSEAVCKKDYGQERITAHLSDWSDYIQRPGREKVRSNSFLTTIRADDWQGLYAEGRTHLSVHT